MSDQANEPSVVTRYDVVMEHILGVINKFGDENYLQMISTCLQDISVTLALILDGQSETNTPSESDIT